MEIQERTVGVVGLGRMGANMARCLHDKGYRIAAVYDQIPGLTAEMAKELEAYPAENPHIVTAKAQIILTVVSDDAAMESLFFGSHNLLRDAQERTFINCATLSPRIHHRVTEAARAAGAQCLEACMASSIPQARKGELFLIVAGDPAVFDSMQPLLKDLSLALHYVGETGRAAQVKALVNMVMNSNTAALAEGLGLGQALGLDPETLCAIFRQTGAHSRVLETDAADMIQRDHECYFSAEHAAKDSGIALDLARQSGLHLPLAQATLDQYQRLLTLGLGHLDKSAVAELTFPGRAGSHPHGQ